MSRLPDTAVIQVRRQPAGTVTALVQAPGAAPRSLPHVELHFPAGFDFGYGGSRPANLALSILTACVGRRKAEKFHLAFKWAHLATETRRVWSIQVGTVRATVARYLRVLPLLDGAGGAAC